MIIQEVHKVPFMCPTSTLESLRPIFKNYSEPTVPSSEFIWSASKIQFRVGGVGVGVVMAGAMVEIIAIAIAIAIAGMGTQEGREDRSPTPLSNSKAAYPLKWPLKRCTINLF